MPTKKHSIYLDYASATPVDPAVLRVLTETTKKYFANPSALHRLGVEARMKLEESRQKVAQVVGAHSDEVVFVSGGTESDNLAVMGTVRAAQKRYPNMRPHIILSAIEHAAVITTVEMLSQAGVDVSYVPVTQDGQVDLKVLRKLFRPETVLVSIILANNEIGTIEPIQEIAKEVRHARRHKHSDDGVGAPYPLLHTDASQALNYIEINVEKMGVDLLTINGSKLYGPKGTGALYIKRRTPIEPIMFGGDQEFGLRPGTEALPAYVAFAEAVTIANKLRHKEVRRLEKLQHYFITKLQKLPYHIRINGGLDHRLPNNINFTVAGYQSEMLVIYLDARGIFVSSKSACKSTDPESSHVIKALGYETDDAETGSLRISMGRGTTKQDLEHFFKEFSQVLDLLKR
jgi:cysteine desulfurase